MKEQEKQIEEMAKDLEPFITLHREVYVSANRKEKHGWMLSEEDNKVIAEVLVKQGYRKIDNSVVLSREEYEKLKHFENRVRSGVCLTQKEWFDFCNKDSNRRTCLRIEEREKERKETAEEILNAVVGAIDNGTFSRKSFIFMMNKVYGVEVRNG
jgi:hypothetical protein